MNIGLIAFIKTMIDDRVSLIVQTEIEKQIKHRLNEVEIKLMKMIQRGLGVGR